MKWTIEKENLLECLWGQETKITISKEIGVSISAINAKATRMKLGKQADNFSSKKFTLDYAASITGVKSKTFYKVWCQDNNLEIQHFGKYIMIDETALAKFMETHPNLYHAIDCDSNYFGKYDWFVAKKAAEIKNPIHTKKWDSREIGMMMTMKSNGKSFEDIAEKLHGRSPTAISSKYYREISKKVA